MLLLTENASTAIRTLITDPDLPDASGIRIASEGTPGRSEDLAVSTVVNPEPGDEVLDQQGARVFLDPDAATFLDDKVLDAAVDEAGYLRFVVVAP